MYITTQSYFKIQTSEVCHFQFPAPMPTPPDSLRESAELMESENDSPTQVVLQSPSTGKPPVEIPVSEEERKSAVETAQVGQSLPSVFGTSNYPQRGVLSWKKMLCFSFKNADFFLANMAISIVT